MAWHMRGNHTLNEAWHQSSLLCSCELSRFLEADGGRLDGCTSSGDAGQRTCVGKRLLFRGACDLFLLRQIGVFGACVVEVPQLHHGSPAENGRPFFGLPEGSVRHSMVLWQREGRLLHELHPNRSLVHRAVGLALLGRKPWVRLAGLVCCQVPCCQCRLTASEGQNIQGPVCRSTTHLATPTAWERSSEIQPCKHLERLEIPTEDLVFTLPGDASKEQERAIGHCTAKMCWPVGRLVQVQDVEFLAGCSIPKDDATIAAGG
mmetsp:Transcript_56495/g.131988  ORF Transcript_56495/g.131988 Transcript_56495/m.131988 type:complete len:262 (+) Transcript_56495:372-1157(+)